MIGIPQADDKGCFRWTEALAAAGIAFFLFLPAVRFSFVHYDDFRYVVENVYVQSPVSWNTIQWAFTSCQDALWAPFSRLSHVIDGQLFGLHPAGHHATNVLLHVANTVLVYCFFCRASGSGKRALVVAILFAVHPFRVEAVAWVAARKELLCAFFLLMTLNVYDGYVRRGRFSAYALACFLCAAAILSKPMAVTLPAVLLLLDIWPYARLDRRSVFRCLLEKVPFLFLSLGVCIITLYADQKAIVPVEYLPISTRITHAIVAYALYMLKSIIPYPLYIPYMVTPDFAPVWKIALATVLLFGFIGSVLYGFRRRAYMFVGVCWFFGMFVPVIGFIPFGHHVMADRFTYLPQIGLIMAVVWGVAECMPGTGLSRRAVQSAAAIGIVMLGAVTVLQLGTWRDTGTLFRHTLEFEPDSYVAHSNLGFYFMERNRPLEAIPHFQRACDIKPDRVESFNDLGAAYLGAGRNQEAVRVLAGVVERQPKDPEFQTNLGIAWYMNGEREEARLCAEKALLLRPGFSKAQLLLQHLNTGGNMFKP